MVLEKKDGGSSARSETLGILSDFAIGLSSMLVLVLWLPYLLARSFGLPSGAWASVGVLLLGIAYLMFQGVAVYRRGKTGGTNDQQRIKEVTVLRWWPVLLVILVTAGLAYLFYNTSLRDRDGSLFSQGGGCEDMGMHATLAHAFLRTHDRIIHPTYPIFPGWPLGYPFLADFSAATVMTLGASIGTALFVTALFALLALITNIYAIGRLWLSPPYAALAFVLFFLGGNLGIIFFFRDLRGAPFVDIWLNDYANNFNYYLHYGNMVTAVLIPMRTVLFGAPIALSIVAMLNRRRNAAATVTWGDRLITGILLGSLPLVSTHSFLAGGIYFVGHILYDPTRRVIIWWPAMLTAAALALPQVYWIHQQTSASLPGFISVANGFLSPTSLSWPKYWALNGGLFIPLGLIAWFFSERGLRAAMLPLLLLFPLAIVLWFQPNPFDNIKLLLFFHFGCAVLIADLCRRSIARGFGATLIAFLSVLICTATGALSLVREANIPCEMASAVDREFATVVLRATDERSVVLTGHRFTHPVPFLTGRTIVIGFHNWLSQHGIPYEERAADVRSIYGGMPEAKALIEKYGITDIVVGPAEREEFPNLNEQYLSSIAQPPIVSGPYKLYRLRKNS